MRHPLTLPSNRVSNPKCINSLAPISEPIKLIDRVDRKFTPEVTLQHIEARVSFSLGLRRELLMNTNFGMIDAYNVLLLDGY